MVQYKIPLDDRLTAFATAILQLAQDFPKTPIANRLADQMTRSGTSIGANYEGATAAESKADFAHKMQIALKECRETCYWLRILSQANLLPKERIQPLLTESMELRAMLTSSVLKVKNRN
jgi:four helix bundle protein